MTALAHREHVVRGMIAAMGAFFMFTVMNTFAKLLSVNHRRPHVGTGRLNAPRNKRGGVEQRAIPIKNNQIKLTRLHESGFRRECS